MLPLRWILSLAFALAAGLKMGGVGTGTGTIFGTLSPTFQWAIVAAELALAAWLVSEHLPRIAALATITLLSIFLARIIFEMGKPDPNACGCFGPITTDTKSAMKTLWTSLYIDVVLIAAAVIVWFTVKPTSATSATEESGTIAKLTD